MRGSYAIQAYLYEEEESGASAEPLHLEPLALGHFWATSTPKVPRSIDVPRCPFPWTAGIVFFEAELIYEPIRRTRN
jgi:hypothetical protein